MTSTQDNHRNRRIPSASSTAGERLQNPIFTERRMRIICIGAGASGLCFAYKLQRSFSNFELFVYEKNYGVSGTWYENRYPGCACDVPAHNYTYSWSPKVDWSSAYAGSDEIHVYFEEFARKNDLLKYIKLGHKVTGASWNEKEYRWSIEIQNLQSRLSFTNTADILINASGILNAWKWPNIQGLDRFEGVKVHSANWDSSIDLTGKSVGLIGNGSSGIQILPAIQSQVRHLITFIRGPTWITQMPGLEQHVFSEEEVGLFTNDPGYHLNYRKEQENRMNSAFSFLKDRNGPEQQQLKHMAIKQMKERLGNEALENIMIPRWAVGCRRLTPGFQYLESLSSPNVEVAATGIQSVNEKGVLCNNGKSYEMDILICATGFDTSFRPRFPIVGLKGENLQDSWAAECKSYLGIAAANIPNYFQYLGPNCPIGNGPVINAIEWQTDYMLKWCDRWQTENVRTFSPKSEAVDDFVAFTDNFMKNTVWADDCHSWYKNNSVSGRISALWPGSTLHYLEAITEVRADDWNITYDGNRFLWLGNGTSRVENDEFADKAWYIRDKDSSEFLSREKRRRVLTRSKLI